MAAYAVDIDSLNPAQREAVLTGITWNEVE